MNIKNKHKISQLSIGIVLSVTSFCSFANGSFTQLGEPKNDAYNQKPLKGFANDLPLIIVMKQITPNGWIVKKSDTEDNKLDVKKIISWQGGKNWVDTLNDISIKYNIDMKIDWEKKVITLSNPVEKPKEVEKKALFILADSETKIETPKVTKEKDVAVGASEQNNEITTKANEVVDNLPKVTLQNNNQVWLLEPHLSLKENVEIWANLAGYRLVWTGEDYGVGQPNSLVGVFDSENGPIKQLSVDYGPSSRVQVPLSFQFYQNKTLVVENWLFEQSGFPQFNKNN